MRNFTLPLLLLAMSISAFAQSSAEFNQRLGQCSAQADRNKRSLCFERLSKEAVAALDKLSTSSVGPGVAVIQQAKPPSRHADLIVRAKANVATSFLDPGSVQWRGLYISNTDTRPSALVLCGEVNAKNSYGAYVGFRRFFASADPEVRIIDTGKEQSSLAQNWGVACAQEVEKVE